ncbi:1,4-dihydroxy-2-naphthoyl-CoA hydrolase [bacterium HR40]|nr:1,4-dihydroxy-2-naphthoyl-CoA hydrolase [bacterium HR40]
MTADVDLLRRLVPATGPFQEFLGYRAEVAADGSVGVVLEIGERHLSQYGIAHGGVTLTLLDTAGGLAVLMAAPRLVRVATISLAANFVRSVERGRVVATARLDYIGGAIAHAAMRLCAESAEGPLLATGHGAYRLFRERGSAADEPRRSP